MANMKVIPLPFSNIQEAIEKEEFIRKLPAKKRRFVEAYTTCYDARKTAHILNMSMTRVYKYLKDEQVQTAIRYTQDLIAMRNQITQDYFVSQLREIIEGHGKVTEKIQALQLLARITGFLKDKIDTTNQNLVVVRLEGNEEL